MRSFLPRYKVVFSSGVFYGAEEKRGTSTVDSRLLFRIIAADRKNLTAYSGVLYAGGH